MERIRNWYWGRRHGFRAVRVRHVELDGVDITITTFKETGRHELPSRPVYGPFELEPVLPN